jgi:hypothetical protein
MTTSGEKYHHDEKETSDFSAIMRLGLTKGRPLRIAVPR